MLPLLVIVRKVRDYYIWPAPQTPTTPQTLDRVYQHIMIFLVTLDITRVSKGDILNFHTPNRYLVFMIHQHPMILFGGAVILVYLPHHVDLTILVFQELEQDLYGLSTDTAPTTLLLNQLPEVAVILVLTSHPLSQHVPFLVPSIGVRAVPYVILIRRVLR
jgi:hypothetical protein